MNFRVISRAEILSLITMDNAIEAMARGFSQLSAGQVEMPVRVVLSSGDGFSLFMPARLGATGGRGAKIASLFPGNRDRGLATINGVILMIDDETGLPAAIMDAGELTAIRTAAAAGLAARLLSRPDCRVLTIFGAGAQAPWQIEAIRAVRPIKEVRVVSKGGESARRLVASLEGVEARAVADSAEAVDGADIIVAGTTAGTPVFDGAGLPAGTHVSGSGSFQPHTREVGDEVVTRARVVVEEREAVLEEAGDLIIP
ncbi:MAG: ornithine cyclodeaminase family protein, partial [Gemmatimonadetes bacterium]|nr:ornithine cyclodeaminase family protein [Gemmatimonadota bacterium]